MSGGAALGPSLLRHRRGAGERGSPTDAASASAAPTFGLARVTRPEQSHALKCS